MLLPVYSATEAKEEAAEAVSQSRSVLRLGLRLRIGKASSDSTLQAEKDKVLKLHFSLLFHDNPYNQGKMHAHCCNRTFM